MTDLEPMSLSPTSRRRRGEPDWTYGLKLRTANTLRLAGFTSREQVRALPEQKLMRIAGFGVACLIDLQSWLGKTTDPASRKNPRS